MIIMDDKEPYFQPYFSYSTTLIEVSITPPLTLLPYYKDGQGVIMK